MNRIRVNRDELAPVNTYQDFPRFWEDITFSCVDCGKTQRWSAEEQREFYEVAKNPIYVKMVRCQRCKDMRIADREDRRLFSEALQAARNSDDPALIRAGVVAIMKHGEQASGGARKALKSLLSRLSTEHDDDIVRRARSMIRSDDG